MSVRATAFACLLPLAASLASCDRDAGQSPERPQSRKAGFADAVAPILREHCAGCHAAGGQGAEASGLRLDSYATIMAGTRFGPVIVPGSAMTSSLYLLVSGKDRLTVSMPHGKAPLGADEIETIRAWIDNGAAEN